MKVICPTCKSEKQLSRVTLGRSKREEGYYRYYDEEGNEHCHFGKRTQTYQCSNGHTGIITTVAYCNNKGCPKYVENNKRNIIDM